MKISCGTDIIEIDRIRESIEKLGQNFLDKLYTENEIEYCENKGRMKFQHYAGRFAAKEAIFKAISGIIEDEMSLDFTDAEIINNEKRKPTVKFLKNIEKLENIIDLDISISHCKNYAVSTVVVMYEDI